MKIDLEEPNYPGNDSDEVKAIVPNQTVAKDPQIENTGNNEAIVYLKVEVPQEEYTELGADNVPGEKKLQDLFTLKDVSDQWELIRTETTTTDDGKTKTSYIYAYKKPLGKGETTDKLFQKVQMKNSMESDLAGKVEDIIVTAYAIQSTDVSDISLTPGQDGNLGKDVLDQVYEIFLNQSGQETPRPADEGNRSQTGKLGKITYDLDGGTLEGAMTEYGTADYGYVPPTPVRENYTFEGWEPAALPDGSTENVIFTAKWTADVLGSIQYNLDGGTMSGEKTEYTLNDFGYVPPTPIKEGYKFTGWEPENIPSNSTGNMTFTAHWEESSAELLDGASINVKMKKLAGNSSTNYNSKDTAISAIQRSDEAPSDAVMEDANSLISTDASAKPVYAWYEDGAIKWWSDAEYVNADSGLLDLCYYMTKLADISGLGAWNVSNVTNMSSMFYDCYQLADLTPLTNWQTGKVTDISSMFYNCNQLTDLTPLTNWQTGKVTDMSSMFYNCSQLTDLTPLVNWDTSNVTDMSIMFGGCSKLTDLTPLTNWQTGKVTDMKSMFTGWGKLTDLTPLANWQTSKVTNMRSMFSECYNLADLTPLANWQTGNVTSMGYMFQKCSKLTDLTPLTNWQTSNVTNMDYMFYSCGQLTDLTPLTNWQTGKVTNMYCIFADCRSLIDLTPLANWDTSSVTKMSYMFSDCSQLTDLTPLTNWQTGNVTDMSCMFHSCSQLTDLTPLANWNTGNVTTMSSIFASCRSLTDLTPLANWDTSSVTKNERYV